MSRWKPSRQGLFLTKGMSKDFVDLDLPTSCLTGRILEGFSFASRSSSDLGGVAARRRSDSESSQVWKPGLPGSPTQAPVSPRERRSSSFSKVSVSKSTQQLKVPLILTCVEDRTASCHLLIRTKTIGDGLKKAPLLSFQETQGRGVLVRQCISLVRKFLFSEENEWLTLK